MSFTGVDLACEVVPDYEVEVDVDVDVEGEGERDVQCLGARGLLSPSTTSGSGELSGEEDIEAVVIREAAMGSRAITSAAIKSSWGSPRARPLVHAITAITFLYLLRVGEASNLRTANVTIHPTKCTSINLSQRKTDPYGGMI
jgi:hypothetical protein